MESDRGALADGKFFRILSLDGGGIRGVFPAAFLARLEEHLEQPIGRYFDLIAGTSTGGIIAIGLGLGLPAREILDLYVQQGPAIFDQQHGPLENSIRRCLRSTAHLLVTKHPSEPLRAALEGVLGRRRLGESRTRLVIPAWHPVLERVYIYKTAHHPRLETDFRQPAIDAAMATAAAPTFLKPHMTESAVELVDGGVWANNPIGVAAIEAVVLLALVTFATRIGGVGIMAYVAITPRIEAFLKYMATSVLISIVLPTALRASPRIWLAVGAAAITMAVTRSALGAMICGTLLAAAAWNFAL